MAVQRHGESRRMGFRGDVIVPVDMGRRLFSMTMAMAMPDRHGDGERCAEFILIGGTVIGLDNVDIVVIVSVACTLREGHDRAVLGV